MSGEIGELLPDGLHNTRLDWIIPTIGITGDVVEEGVINLTTEDGETVEVQIITPVSGDQEHESRNPPFTISPDLIDCPGKFTREHLIRSPPSQVPLLVTWIA